MKNSKTFSNKRTLVALLCVSVFLLLASFSIACSQDSHPIYGEWRLQRTQGVTDPSALVQTLEFFPDGTGFSNELSIDWRLEGDRLAIGHEGIFVVVYEVEVLSDELVFHYDDDAFPATVGGTSWYSRVR